MTRALVTGSTGFLGSTLVEHLLARGVEVRGLRRKTSPDDAVEGLKIDFAVGDILDPASLPAAMEGIDWVFHVAAAADHRKSGAEVMYKVNLEGARNVFEAAHKAGVKRLVYTSSTAALGEPRPGKPMLDEADRFNLTPTAFPYGHSKQLAEDALQEYIQQSLDAVIVLPAPIMGPRDLNFISGDAIVEALRGAIPALPPGGANFIDVRDCADGEIAAAERGRCGERYILGGNNMTYREIAETFNAVLGAPVPLLTIPRPLIPVIAELIGLLTRLGIKLPIYREFLLYASQYVYYDNTKAVQELGLKTRPFAESVRDAYLWYADNGYLEKHNIPHAHKPVG
jgi:dihydroflavonol-4-reductase